MRDKSGPNSHWPLGFSATGLRAGLSKKKGKKDMALFFSHVPARGGAVFTFNQAKAAPVLLCEENLMASRGRVRAVVVNSGTANAATGHEGLKDARLTARWAAERLGIPMEEVWIASTGVIGPRLNLGVYKKGLHSLVSRLKGSRSSEGRLAAEAILTTDTVPKVAAATFRLGDVPVRIWACAKGSGMIHPVLRGPHGRLHATMLAFILTDANIRAFAIQRALERVTDRTFNCVSIDGDTSTNDFVGVIANGASGSDEIASLRERNYGVFVDALSNVCEQLTTMIAMDGEGASKLVEIRVEAARSEEGARQMASVVASSPLVKTACHGADPNWGRVLAAMGRSGIRFDPKRVRIWFGEILVCKNGVETSFSEPETIRYLQKREIVIRINLGLGTQASRYKTCDFTGQYVGINAGYRT